MAGDLARGKEINKTCALCHGQFGQGTPGGISPRLAGLPKYYLVKAITSYRDGKRVNLLMDTTSGIKDMTDADIEDISDYLSRIDVSKDSQFDIKQSVGDPDKGKKIYKGDCRTCHGRDGFGKPKKEAPPLAGQHFAYIDSSIKLFRAKNREHADDPEDETFDDYDKTDIRNITAYLATLDDKKFVAGGEMYVPQVTAVALAKPETKTISTGLQITDISQTVAQMELKEGVTKEDAIEAMMSKAAEINLKMVGQQHVSRELEARGVKTPYLTILQFCDPMDARTMIISNPIFASYMPCRIALVEDAEGKPWLMMLNLDMLINSKLLSPDVVETAIRVNQSMLDIMVAGATGEF
jgi:cytochrome c553/uncharacterized protein (DUF302 family)